MKGGGGTLVLACSPRRGGNTDTAAAVAAENLGSGRDVAYLRDHDVLPCVSCGYCSAHPGGPCPLTARDGSAPLLASLEKAASVLVVSPVYFYHVPAQLKALMDRTQPWWTRRAALGLGPGGERVAHAVLIAARPKGDKLFDGAVLSLRYWLGCFGFTLAEPLTLYGLDAPGDLARSSAALEKIAGYAETIRAASVSGT